MPKICVKLSHWLRPSHNVHVPVYIPDVSAVDLFLCMVYMLRMAMEYSLGF